MLDKTREQPGDDEDEVFAEDVEVHPAESGRRREKLIAELSFSEQLQRRRALAAGVFQQGGSNAELVRGVVEAWRAHGDDRLEHDLLMAAQTEVNRLTIDRSSSANIKQAQEDRDGVAEVIPFPEPKERHPKTDRRDEAVNE